MRRTIITTTTQYKCPKCNYLLKEKSDGGLGMYVLMYPLYLILLPFLLVIYPLACLAIWIIHKWFITCDIPPVGTMTETCPKCKQEILTGKIAYELLDPPEKFYWNNRFLIRLSYVIGTVCLLAFLLSFFIFSSDEINHTVGLISLIVFAISLTIDTCIILYFHKSSKNFYG